MALTTRTFKLTTQRGRAKSCTKEDRDVHWSLRQVIGYWLWWRRHRLVTSEKGRPALDFPEFLEWVRIDLRAQDRGIGSGLQARDGALTR